MFPRSCALVLLGLVASCTPMRLVTRHPAPLTPFAPARRATLVLTPLTSSAGALRASEDLPRRLGALFENAGVAILEERSLTEPPPSDAFLVRMALGDSRLGGQSGERAVRTFEVIVFAVTGAPLEAVATVAGIVPMIDVTGRAVVLHEYYELSIDTDLGTRGSYAEEEADYQEDVRVLTAELLYQSLAPDLQRAIDATPASSLASQIVPQSRDGEPTMSVH